MRTFGSFMAVSIFMGSLIAAFIVTANLAADSFEFDSNDDGIVDTHILMGGIFPK